MPIAGAPGIRMSRQRTRAGHAGNFLVGLGTPCNQTNPIHESSHVKSRWMIRGHHGKV